MRILVTGAAGFIGSHLCEALLERGHCVVGYDVLDPYYSPAVKQRNVAAARSSPRFSWVEADVRDRSRLREALSGVEAVYHLAAVAGVRSSISDPQRYIDLNVSGTLAVLEACRECALRRIVFASSSSVYGINRRTPFREDDPILSPISPYAASKIAGEALCHTYAHLYGLPIAAVRFFTVYGPRQRPDMAIHAFARRIVAGEPIPVYGDGNSLRDYTYVGDAVEGLLRLLEAPLGGYEVFNFGSGRLVALHEVIALLERHLGRAVPRRHLPEQAGDVPITFASIDKARRMLGYAPRTELDEGIGRFVEWFTGTLDS
ncbi:MAG TPA: SDR family NAD(P)-dependent oxidoreductase [Limnochordia bacterium]